MNTNKNCTFCESDCNQEMHCSLGQRARNLSNLYCRLKLLTITMKDFVTLFLLVKMNRSNLSRKNSCN